MSDLERHIDALLANSRIDKLYLPTLFGEVKVDLLRDDLIHPEVSGNKLRKLKYNLLAASDAGKQTILTFGGAYSNHIAATAAAGKMFGFRTVGIIRGDELNADSNPTLRQAAANGMELRFVSREEYRGFREGDGVRQLTDSELDAWIIPEGGSNALGIKGCAEISRGREEYSHFICALGTGTTLAGIVSGMKSGQRADGIDVVGGNFLTQAVENQLTEIGVSSSGWAVHSSFAMGGYARFPERLIGFIVDFQELSGIFAEPVYTGKMLSAISKLGQEGYFSEQASILAVHTGGLQGWQGFADLNPFKNKF